MKNKREKIIAVVVSIVLHATFIIICSSYRLPGIIVPSRRKIQLFGIKIAKDKHIMRAIEHKQYLPKRKLEFTASVKNEPVEQFIGKEEKGREKDLGLPKEKVEALKGARVPQEFVWPKERPQDYGILSAKEKRITRPSLQKPIALIGEDLADYADDVLAGQEITEAFVEKMPGFTPALTSRQFDIPQSDEDKKKFAGLKSTPVITRIQERGEFKSDLEWTLETFEDPDDHQKYFRITIRAVEASKNLPTIPKEIVFLIDCSISIQEERLAGFKDGIEYSLEHLNEGDLFNVIAFKKRIISFKPHSVEATEENKQQALSFVAGLRAGERTDVYEALLDSVAREAMKKPSYIILFSDGFPTHGVVNPLELITKVSHVDGGRIPIFAFSGGVAVNRYLLDFISYTNRGWSEYAARTHQIAKKLSQMYDKLDEPIILNLRYYVTGAGEKEIFPRRLPDFFRGAEFTLHGKYSDRDKFVVQLLGDVEGKTSEFIVQGAFSSGTPGDKQIAGDWAFNKIFHLISQVQYDKDNQDLIAQIKDISRKFKIRTPYLHHISR